MMNSLFLCLVVQLYLAFGIAGLFWPERLMPWFGILMFPWRPNQLAIRANGIGAIGAYLLLLVILHAAR